MTAPDVVCLPSRRPGEWVGWAALGLATAVLLTWPLASHLSSVVPQNLGDPLAQAWFLAWGGHGITAAPAHLFTGNTFWPAPTSYAYSDTLFGYAPVDLFSRGPVDATTRYNLVFLFAYALSVPAAALLARELGCSIPAAAVAGTAFAWAPWKIAHTGQLNVISTGGVALALFLLLSGYRRRRRWQILSGWGVASWQMTLGFAMGIYFAYLLAALALCVGVGWLRRGRPVDRLLIVPTVVGSTVLLGVTAVMASPYLAILRRDPSAIRGTDQVAFFSPPMRGLLAAHVESRAWGGATTAIRDTMPWIGEQALFPGVTVVVLAAFGLGWRTLSARRRVALLAATVLTLLLSFGLRLWGGVLYRPLLDYAPGWNGLRTPGRLAFLWTLGLAMLAGMGADRLQTAVARSLPGRGRPTVTAAAGATVLALAAVVAYEGSMRLPLPIVPTEPAALQGLAGPQLHLPSDSGNDAAYMLWSTDGFPRIGNGSASYTPKSLELLRQQTASFPDPASLLRLRADGFRIVVVHRDRIAGTPWAQAADKPVDGLGISRRDDGVTVVFDLSG